MFKLICRHSLFAYFVLFLAVMPNAQARDFLTPKKSVLDLVEDTPTVVEIKADEVASRMNLATPEKDGWRVAVSTNLWLPPVKGEQEKNGLTAEFEASQGERLERFNLSGELFLEFTNGEWTFAFQPHYANVDLDGHLVTPLGDIPLEINAKILTFEFWGAKRFEISDSNNWIEFLAGVKYTQLDSVSQSVFGEDSSKLDWINPVVGVRAQKQVYGPVSIKAQATASGFNLTNSSSDEREFRAGILYDLGKGAQAEAGYRYQKVDYFENELTPTQSRINYTIKGPYLAFTYWLR